MTTTPSTTSTTLAATTAVTDTATVTGHSGSGGAAPAPTGTVEFFICTPSQLTPANTGICSGSNGTQAPAPPTEPVQLTPGSGSSSTATSGNVRSLITVAGKYCFRAHFVAAASDTNYAGQTADLTAADAAVECFTVSGTSGSSSKQRWLPNDRVTLTGDSNLNGTLTVTLYSGTFSGTAANCTAGTATAVPGQSYSITVTDGAKAGASYNTSNTDPATAPNTTFYVGDKA